MSQIDMLIWRRITYQYHTPGDTHVRLASAFTLPLANHPGVPNAVRGRIARTVVTIALPQALLYTTALELY